MNSSVRLACLLLVCAEAAFAASPLSPADALKSFRLADPNLVIELVAAEPDVRAPVAVAWDADGRMFVAEMTDYPSGPVNGRIRRLEDRDGDGRYEHSIIFATNLAYPNGVMAWKNGVLVTAAPDIWFLADTNGDGRADVREKILTGFTEGNQQLRVNGLFWGLDNWIYGCNGRSDGEVKWAEGSGADVSSAARLAGVPPATAAGTAAPLSISIRRHDFRFRPDTKQFEVIAGNSQFGMGYDDWGNRFPVFNNTPIRHVVIEDHYFARQPLLAGTDNVPSISPPDGNRVFALTPPTLLIPQPVGFFTSACGPSIYRGTALPGSYRGNYFVCEPVQNVVQRRVLKPNGSTFVAAYADVPSGSSLSSTGRGKPGAPQEFLASTDRWFHGVFTATGPDGAFYVVDFYRDLVEHPHWVAPEIRDQVDWRKGEEHGRIWRIRARDARPAKVEKLSLASNAGLVRALESSNGWTRDTAQRLLVERDARDSISSLGQLARNGATPQGRIHALNLLEASRTHEMQSVSMYGTVMLRRTIFTNDAIVLNALADPDPHVREHAVRLAGPGLGTNHLELIQTLAALSPLTRDPDARVRLQLASTLGAFISDAERADLLAQLARHPQLDDWQATAILGSAGPRPWFLIHRLIIPFSPPGDAQLALLERATRLVAAGTEDEDRRALLGWISSWKHLERVALAAAFVEGLGPKERLETIVPNEIQLRLIKTSALDAARNTSAPLSLRMKAVRLIGKEEAVHLIGGGEPDALQIAAAKVVLESGHSETIATLFRRGPLSRTVRRQIIASSVRSKAAALELERAVADGKVPLTEVDPATRQALENFKDAEVQARAVELFKGSASQDREAVVAKYRAALKLTGDRARGAAQFERACLVCHQMQGVGAKVGPDLSGIGTHSRETLLVEILDPSRQVLPDFVAYHAETKAGDTYTGFIANESATTVTLRRANEPDLTLPRAELKEFRTGGQSLMPEGLEAGMSEQDVADLVEFLRRPDRTLFYENSKSQIPNPK